MDPEQLKQVSKQLKADFERAGDKIENELIKALTIACSEVKTEAVRQAPIDTGTLRKSMSYRVKSDASEVWGEVGTILEYAPYVEFGTGKYAEGGDGRKTPWLYRDPQTGKIIWTAGNRPQPFLRPALKSKQKRINKLISDAIKAGSEGGKK